MLAKSSGPGYQRVESLVFLLDELRSRLAGVVSGYNGTDLLLAALGGLAVGVVGTMVLGRGTAQAAARPAAGVVPGGPVPARYPGGIGAGGTVYPAGASKTNPYGYLGGQPGQYSGPTNVAVPPTRAPAQVRPTSTTSDQSAALAWLQQLRISCQQWGAMSSTQQVNLITWSRFGGRATTSQIQAFQQAADIACGLVPVAIVAPFQRGGA